MSKSLNRNFSLFNDTLISISTQLMDAPTNSLQKVMNSVLEECRQLLGVDRISCLPHTEYITEEWSLYSVSGKDSPSLKQNFSVEIKSQYQAMINSGNVIDSHSYPQLLTLAKKLQEQPPISHIFIPIQAMGKPWGALAAANFFQEIEFDDDFIRCATILGNILASSIQRLQHFQELSKEKEKVTALNKRLIENSEKQLKMIARDLHDDFGQRLASLNLELGFIYNKLTPDIQPPMRKVATELSNITRDLQHLSRHLHPAVIDKIGLYAAIESEAKKMAMNNAILLSLNVSKEILYNDDQKLHIYRVFQEALSNVMRHSNATELSISLAKKSDQIAAMTLKDNGVGMSKQANDNVSSLGLQSMQERAEIIGGTIKFNKSERKSGCSMTLTWPIPNI